MLEGADVPGAGAAEKASGAVWMVSSGGLATGLTTGDGSLLCSMTDTLSQQAIQGRKRARRLVTEWCEALEICRKVIGVQKYPLAQCRTEAWERRPLPLWVDKGTSMKL